MTVYKQLKMTSKNSKSLINQRLTHTETSQLIYVTDQMTGFRMSVTLS